MERLVIDYDMEDIPRNTEEGLRQGGPWQLELQPERIMDALKEAKDMLSDSRELLRNQCRKDLHAQEGPRDRTETGWMLSVTEAEPTSTCSRAHVQDVQSREGIAACCFRLPLELALGQEIQSNVVGIATRLQQ